MAKAAFGYLRVSSKGQEDGDGFTRQRIAIEQYAAQHGLQIERWFEESVTGKTEWEDRPAWMELIQQFASSAVETILIEKLDRLARDLMVQEHIIQDLQHRGIALISTTEQGIDNDPTRKLIRQMFGAIAEYDRTMTVLKLRSARGRVKAAVGRCEGRKPYGTKSQEERSIVSHIMDRVSAGDTWAGIASSLNQQNVPARMVGRKWYPSTVRRIYKRWGCEN